MFLFWRLGGISKRYFETLFKDENEAMIAEVIQISQFCPGWIFEEDNLDLMEEVSEEELKATLHNF